ncbi:MAG: TIGR01777 family oxidoreductase [Verrucomicrobiales bacterium]
MENESFVRTSLVDASADALGVWHHSPGAFRRLVPPWVRYKIIEEPAALKNGVRSIVKTRLAPLVWSKWVAELKEVTPGGDFSDVQLKGPFAHWYHQHRFIAQGSEKSQLNDAIEYRLPLGRVGKFFGGWHVERQLAQLFRYRHTITTMDLKRAREHPVEPLRILVSGASGLVGTALTAFLETCGHEVLSLTRSPRPGSNDVRWDIGAGEIDLSSVGKIDAVVHLAGENVAGRWTKKKKQRILSSRRDGTKLLCEAIARLPTKPAVLVSASGINYYELDPLNSQDEDSPIGTGFLAEVCRAWEDNTQAARGAGIRVVNLRIGFVLTPAGGGLKLMLPAFKAGLGGPIGNGRQRLSWISIDDLTDIIHTCLGDERYEGPVNAVAPEPATNREFSKALGRTLHRPAVIPAPAFALRRLLGEFAKETVLPDLPVYPKRLQENGYEFRFGDLETALSHLLGRPAPDHAHQASLSFSPKD